MGNKLEALVDGIDVILDLGAAGVEKLAEARDYFEDNFDSIIDKIYKATALYATAKPLIDKSPEIAKVLNGNYLPDDMGTLVGTIALSAGIFVATDFVYRFFYNWDIEDPGNHGDRLKFPGMVRTTFGKDDATQNRN